MKTTYQAEKPGKFDNHWVAHVIAESSAMIVAPTPGDRAKASSQPCL